MGDDRGELEAFKELNLAELASAYGYELDRRESGRCNLVMRHPDGDKVIIATGLDGHGIFYSTRTDRSGSVIDFVMFRKRPPEGKDWNDVIKPATWTERRPSTQGGWSR
jgi:hypothetical protein